MELPDLLKLDLQALAEKEFGPKADDFAPPPLPTLTPKQELLTRLDSSFWMDRKYPPVGILRSEFPNVDIESFLQEIEPALAARGLPPYKVEPRVGKNELDGHFVLACNLVLDFADSRSLAAKLKELGLTTRKWNALLKVKKNKEYFQKRVDEMFDEDVKTEAKVALAKLVAAGDLNTIKYFHEFTGIYRGEAQTVAQLQQIILILMEILAKHVSPAVLMTVAEEIEHQPSIKELMK
jgi:hypothetical protein